MTEAPAAPDSPAPATSVRPRSRTRAQRLARRREREADDLRLLTLLAAGVGTAELALREGVPARRMRDRIAALLARREAEPPAAFVPSHVARLGDAMKVAYAAMMGGDLKALDRVLRVGRELERYCGPRPPEPQVLPPPAALPRLAAPAPPPALPAPQNGQATKICIAND
jgi:hypothetical protein